MVHVGNLEEKKSNRVHDDRDTNTVQTLQQHVKPDNNVYMTAC